MAAVASHDGIDTGIAAHERKLRKRTMGAQVRTWGERAGANEVGTQRQQQLSGSHSGVAVSGG